jgi:hypothetical protein
MCGNKIVHIGPKNEYKHPEEKKSLEYYFFPILDYKNFYSLVYWFWMVFSIMDITDNFFRPSNIFTIVKYNK